MRRSRTCSNNAPSSFHAPARTCSYAASSSTSTPWVYPISRRIPWTPESSINLSQGRPPSSNFVSCAGRPSVSVLVKTCDICMCDTFIITMLTWQSHREWHWGGIFRRGGLQDDSETSPHRKPDITVGDNLIRFRSCCSCKGNVCVDKLSQTFWSIFCTTYRMCDIV